MTTIPLEILKIDNGYHILCRIHIRNEEYRMLVDTGASLTMFDIKKIKKLSDNEIITDGSLSAGFTGQMENKFIYIDEMHLGNVIINNYKIMLINFDNFNYHFKSNGYPMIDGIIGGDILFKYKVIIDYENRELILV